ncbi:hypothetical protein IAD21_04215 [Abditibacteriota bacterium]|nr:hypothetical protein IAD21_04215 [Abditibacteriota bacterium]
MAIVLSWDNKPERQAWSAALLSAVDLHLAALEKGKPNMFIAGYDGLSSEKQRVFWAELVIGMAKYESSWNPHSIYHEPPPLGVGSVGLLQLSYEDAQNYEFPDILKPAQKSLEDPLINLRCGLVILSHWLAKDKVVASGSTSSTSKGGARYWSVLRKGTNHHYYEIRKRVKTAVDL